VLVHPESLGHALVGFRDGALMAHMGPPDMRHAIGFALNWPNRKRLPVERLDLAAIGQLNFRAPEAARYPALAIAQTVMEEGGLTGAVFNAAKEQALDGFLAGECGFTDMARTVDTVVDVMLSREGLQNATITLDSVNQADQMARAFTCEEILKTES
jgi:1-deoxy-D-xylulose-5-phosphate reductoisomerase